MASYGIIFLLTFSVLAIGVPPVALQGIGLVGQPCDPVLFEKIIKPMADRHEQLLLENYQDTPEQINTTTETLKELVAAVNKSMIEERPDQPPNNMSIVCNGFLEPYLTCDPTTKLCKCKTQFPFSTATDGKQCYANRGSICAISVCRQANDYELFCTNGYLCSGYGRGEKTGYCGGVIEFERSLEELYPHLLQNQTANQNRAEDDDDIQILSGEIQTQFIETEGHVDMHEHTDISDMPRTDEPIVNKGLGNGAKVSWALVLTAVNMFVIGIIANY